MGRFKKIGENGQDLIDPRKKIDTHECREVSVPRHAHHSEGLVPYINLGQFPLGPSSILLC